MAAQDSVTSSIGMVKRKESKRGGKKDVTSQGVPNSFQTKLWPVSSALVIGGYRGTTCLCGPRLLRLRRTAGIIYWSTCHVPGTVPSAGVIELNKIGFVLPSGASGAVG